MDNLDTSELDDLADAFAFSASRAGAKVLATTRRAALEIKKDAAQRVSGLAHAPHYPRSITYDVTVDGDTVEAEIGPDKDRRQGDLGNLIEFGSVNNPPNPHLLPALDAELPKWLRHVADATGDLL